MVEAELLRVIHVGWINRAVQNLAQGSGVRQDFREQLEVFFDLLGKAADTGDPSWLDSILQDWSSVLTQTDLEDETSSLSKIIQQLATITLEVCKETLQPQDALALFSTLYPALTYATHKAVEEELKVRINYISNQLSEAKQALERLDQTKSDFIAVAAHELKTPLTLVEGYSAMLRDQIDHGSPSSYEIELLSGIANGTKRLRAIIDDMIDVSLIDNSLLSLNFQPVWLNRLFVALQNEVLKALEDRHQQLTIVPFEGSGDLTFGDPERLMQVFRNLILNAIKYTPDGGYIRLDGRRLPGFIEVLVQDSGIGISLEDQSVIFEKFTRLGNTSLHSSGKTKFKGGGPGLGLHIAKGIIEAHGGAIWVESPGFDEQKCPGSTFHVLLPILQAPPDDKSAKLYLQLTQHYHIPEEIYKTRHERT